MKLINRVVVLLASLLFVISFSAYGLTIKTKTPGIAVPKVNVKAPAVPEMNMLEPLDPTLFSISKKGVINPSFAYWHLSCAQLPNGKIVATWINATPDNKFIGEVAIFSQDMTLINSVSFTEKAGDQMFDETRIIPLDNNNFMIAYADKIAANAKLLILNDSLETIKAPSVFNDSGTNSITFAYMPGRKTVLLAYQKLYGVTGRGEFQVLNVAGETILGPVIFNNKGYTRDISAAIVNGLIFLNYTCGFAENKVMDPYGNLVRDDFRFLVKPMGENAAYAREDGNVLLVYRSDAGLGNSVILSEQGTIVSGPTLICPDGMVRISSSKKKDGNIFALYTNYDGSTERSLFTVLDPNGNRIKELKLVDDTASVWNDMVAHTTLSNGKVLIIYAGARKNADQVLVEQFTKYLVVN